MTHSLINLLTVNCISLCLKIKTQQLSQHLLRGEHAAHPALIPRGMFLATIFFLIGHKENSKFLFQKTNSTTLVPCSSSLNMACVQAVDTFLRIDKPAFYGSNAHGLR